MPPRQDIPRQDQEVEAGPVPGIGSFVDPDTLNLDPESEFWPNLDPDPGLC